MGQALVSTCLPQSNTNEPPFRETEGTKVFKQTVDKWEENWEDFEDSGEKDTPSKPLENQTTNTSDLPPSSLQVQTTTTTTTTTIVQNKTTTTINSTATKEVKQQEDEDFFKDLQVNYKPAKKIDAPVAPSKRLLLNDEPQNTENNNSNWDDDLNI